MIKTKIALIDDHALVRSGLREILEGSGGFRVVGEARTGQEGVECVRRLNPDVVLLDLQLPDMTGFDVAQKLLQQHPDIKILVVSAVVQDLSVFRLLEAGARGYVNKGAPPEELVQAIKAIQSGQRFLSPRLAGRLALGKINHQKESAFAKITDREMEVLQQVIRGIPVKNIAKLLKISHKTVHSYRDRIFEKLGVDGDLAVTLLAIQHGLLILEPADP